MLVDAAVAVMARDPDGLMSLNDVLSEAGLSTRAFYRHFDSKEALVETLMLKEAESVARSLGRVVAAAPDPVAGLTAWLDRFLEVFYEPRRAERTALLSAVAYRESRPSAQAVIEMRRISCAPLVEALRVGNESGVLYSPTPEADAYSIHDLVVAGHDATDIDTRNREATRAHVLRFAWPALRLEP